MATNAAGARAARRAAAAAASNTPRPPQAQPVPPQAPVEYPDALDDLMDEVDAAFGPDEIASPQATSGPRKPQNPRTVPNPTNGARVAPEATSEPEEAVAAPSVPTVTATGPAGPLAMPMEDLSRKIDIGDLVIPKLRISQAMSQTNTLFSTSRGADGVGMGNWYVTGANKSLDDTVWFVPVDMRKSRALFLAGEGLQCRSFDMVNGEGNPGGLCEGTYEERLTVPEIHRGCPLRHWQDKTPPKCGVTYNFPGLLIPDIDNPNDGLSQVILQLRSASTQAAKQINTFVMNEGQRVWHNVILEMTVVSKTNTRGTFFIPTVDLYDTTDAEGFERVLRRAAMMARGMGSQDLRSSIENDPDNS